MEKLHILITLVSLVALTACKEPNPALLEPYLAFPKTLKEVSGLVYDKQSSTFWVLQDKGNKPELYQLDTLGNLLHTLKIKTNNTDWEELTMDPVGNLYIGDFGNNDNTREDLRILKINKDSLNLSQTLPDYYLDFYYPEQNQFPPKQNELLYDAEAFITYENNFYIFTKNRSKTSTGKTLVYKVSYNSQKTSAELLTTISTCDSFRDCAITGATLVPNTKDVLLLTNSSIFKLTEFLNFDFDNLQVTNYPLNHTSQKESITFKNSTNLFTADEKKKDTGAMIYQVNYDRLVLKTKP